MVDNFTRPYILYKESIRLSLCVCVYVSVCVCFQCFLSDNRFPLFSGPINLKLGGEIERQTDRQTDRQRKRYIHWTDRKLNREAHISWLNHLAYRQKKLFLWCHINKTNKWNYVPCHGLYAREKKKYKSTLMRIVIYCKFKLSLIQLIWW